MNDNISADMEALIEFLEDRKMSTKDMLALLTEATELCRVRMTINIINELKRQGEI